MHNLRDIAVFTENRNIMAPDKYLATGVSEDLGETLTMQLANVVDNARRKSRHLKHQDVTTVEHGLLRRARWLSSQPDG